LEEVHYETTVPTVRDRVVQMAAKIVIEPIFEADFEASSYGFRPKRSATEALEAIRIAGNQGHDFVVDADIKGYLDTASYCPLIHEIIRIVPAAARPL
jgi:RNA-directed DNA polymerase